MSVLAKSIAAPSARIDALRYGLAAIFLGIVFIGVAGFAHYPALHDAAHDTRHAASFPCH
jgi:cobalt transporter subunit CbtB